MSTLLDKARAAGRVGQSWNEWTASDEVQDSIFIHEFDTDAVERAFAEGKREYRIANGWRVAWTTAPADYDSFGTETVEECGVLHGKPLRRVLIDPSVYVYQTSRYGSGLNPAWDEDPRVADARMRARLEQDRAERQAREENRAAGLAWLRTATEEELEDYDTCAARAVTSIDARAERERRETEKAEKARQAEWARCLALIPEGATLIDDGEPSKRGQFGVIPGREPSVYYGVRIVRGWPDEADRAYVEGEGGKAGAGSASLVADWIASGRLRVATPEDDVPPRAVLERIGGSRKDIRRVVAAGRTVWVGRPRFSSEPLVLDEKGHLVRVKRVLEEALR